MSEELREGFEAWLNSKFISLDGGLNEFTGKFEYVYPHVQTMWVAWQAATACIRQHDDWQDIATAPKDGTEILGYRDDCGVILIRWDCAASFLTDREQETWDEDALFQVDWFAADFVQGSRLEGSEAPTHWRHLPAPPKENSNER